MSVSKNKKTKVSKSTTQSRCPQSSKRSSAGFWNNVLPTTRTLVKSTSPQCLLSTTLLSTLKTCSPTTAAAKTFSYPAIIKTYTILCKNTPRLTWTRLRSTNQGNSRFSMCRQGTQLWRISWQRMIHCTRKMCFCHSSANLMAKIFFLRHFRHI